ncbi:hypothetical protein BJX65DRAFT_276647 [Aspergillus insuetus]
MPTSASTNKVGRSHGNHAYTHQTLRRATGPPHATPDPRISGQLASARGRGAKPNF